MWRKLTPNNKKRYGIPSTEVYSKISELEVTQYLAVDNIFI